ncbi:hypothetical protein BC830DRAFT_1113342 [Chytriomyces sp. MP71]|nr:hypothetical protein BC830DRAFT_1113342 [Chytriomyces sp. MP71]
MCRKLDVLYQSWIRQRATRVIPIPRLTRSISQLLDLLTLQKFFSKWSLLNVMQQLAIQHGNLKLMGRMTFLWLSRLGYNFENQKTAEQFNKNRIQVRQWDVWTIQLDIRKDCRQRLEVKRKILMSWHHWAETESSIRRFVLLHSFKKWKEKLNLRDRSRKLIKKADKMRKIHLFQTFFYQWWRTANLRISQNADAMRSDTDIRQFMSASQLSSTGWLPSLMQYNESQPLMQDNSTTMHASWLGKRIMSAEDFMNLEETADVFRLSKLQHNAWIKLKTLNKSRMFERQRKLIFAEGWARKMLKKKVLIAWSKVLR